eukprot:TRINITY_DN135_c0_g1_i5.p1 TRINITY_DN135_c0_g1~~TRINITY_DN135_c0_g1_i5.p1  ORF type:complete len:286 (+),score=94.88 TRINITY_DN135_c0_g1_i5:68-859(+)
MPMTKLLMRKAFAEAIGTFWLVLGGCGSAVMAAGFPYASGANPLGIGLLGVALAFGLTVMTMAFTVGHVSGGHFNPAVTVGLCAAQKFPLRDVPVYWLAQLVGAIAAAASVYFMASERQGGLELAGSNPMAVNGYGEYSPSGYSLGCVFFTEALLTCMFLIVILGSTDARAPQGFAPISIGLALTLIHLISIPISNTSVNPARSTGVAFFAGRWAHWAQLWMFWVAPCLGAALGGVVHRFVLAPVDKEDDEMEPVDSPVAKQV